MTLAISEQTVIITGAGRGLGAAIAAAFAREGAKVAINYRNSRIEAEALAASLGDRARAFQADRAQRLDRLQLQRRRPIEARPNDLG